MSAEFSANISTLRREKCISQKQAAKELGISQALLSHYEKGIRECNLDFVLKAAEYYNVTTDYLLGASSSKNGLGDFSDTAEIPGDSQMKLKTLLRSFYYLLSEIEFKDEAAEIFFTDYFTLCISKYLSLLNKNNKEKRLSDLSIDILCDSVPDLSDTVSDFPLFLKTLKEHADFLINSNLNNLTDNS